jgi:hypothetical protein
MFQSQPKWHWGFLSMLPLAIGELPSCQGTKKGCSACRAAPAAILEWMTTRRLFAPAFSASVTSGRYRRKQLSASCTSTPLT